MTFEMVRHPEQPTPRPSRRAPGAARPGVRWAAMAAGVALAIGAPAWALAQVSAYDPATGRVTIPSVQVGPATYTDVVLQQQGARFELAAARGPAPLAFPAVGRYDTATGVLALPAVRVGADTYLDVTLQDQGDLAFGLTGARPMPAGLMAEVEALARSIEAQTATSVPASGAARLALVDACWRSDGRSRADFIAAYDADVATIQQRDAIIVGRRIEGIQVLALRETTNPDGSARREVDVQWDTVYVDGTRVVGERSTLISGSSAGTPGCATAQVGPTLRALGNQRLARVEIRANNLREVRYALDGGAPLSPQVRVRREVEFYISDPLGHFTYAVVQGPGPGNTIGGTPYPFSMKMISPRLLRDAPELQGKPGHFINWADDDGFRNCFFSNGSVPIAQFVDCAASGATSSSWGWGYVGTGDAAADAGFEAQGWVAGGVYRIDLYNDDGWKTVNGQAGRTPVATYFATLSRLPYRFVDMEGRYPVPALASVTPAQAAANVASANPVPLALNWNRPTLPGAPMQLGQVWEFHQGPRTGNPGTTFNPAVRSLVRTYPGSQAEAASVPVSPLLPQQARKTYTEFNLFFMEPGTVNTVRSRIVFQ